MFFILEVAVESTSLESFRSHLGCIAVGRDMFAHTDPAAAPGIPLVRGLCDL